MRNENYSRKTTGPGHQRRACMPLVSLIHTLTIDCECVDMFPRHLRFVWKSELRVVILFMQNTDRRAKQLTSKAFSMTIGPRIRPSLLYRVSSHHRQPVRSYLMEKRRGRGRRKASLPSRFAVLPKCYRSSLCNHRLQLANNVRAGGICTLIAP